MQNTSAVQNKEWTNIVILHAKHICWTDPLKASLSSAMSGILQRRTYLYLCTYEYHRIKLETVETTDLQAFRLPLPKALFSVPDSEHNSIY